MILRRNNNNSPRSSPSSSPGRRSPSRISSNNSNSCRSNSNSHCHTSSSSSHYSLSFRRWAARLLEVKFRFMLVVGFFPIVLIAQWHVFTKRSILLTISDYNSFFPSSSSYTTTTSTSTSITATATPYATTTSTATATTTDIDNKSGGGGDITGKSLLLLLQGGGGGGGGAPVELGVRGGRGGGGGGGEGVASSAEGEGIIPPFLYQPSVSSKPLSVIYIGAAAAPPSSSTSQDPSYSSSLLLDALDRSKYLRVVQRILYDPTSPSRRILVSTTTSFTNSTTTLGGSSSSRSTSSSSSTTEESLSVVVVDWGGSSSSLERDCHALHRILGTVSPLEDTFTHKSLLLVYWDASNNARTRHCPQIIPFRSSSLMMIEQRQQQQQQELKQQQQNYDYYYVQRSVVQGRHWNADREWVDMGSQDDSSTQNSKSFRLVHAPHELREAFVKKLWQVVNVNNDDVADDDEIDSNNSSKATATATATTTTFTLRNKTNKTKPTQVAHYWRKGGILPYSFLRRQVGLDVQAAATKAHLRWMVRVVGETSDKKNDMPSESESKDSESRGDDSRHNPLEEEEDLLVSKVYVEALVSTQIVVVAQHDEWEGHWRLLESMASGAMVLSDVMLALPAGLENNTNIVFYDSSENLQQLILYYSKEHEKRQRIAKKGMEYALGTQRGWHRVEQVLFGKPLTRAAEPYIAKPPKRRNGLVMKSRNAGENVRTVVYETML